MSIKFYLLFDLLTYFLCIISHYKKLKFKYLIDDINIDFLSFKNFANMEDTGRECNLTVNLSKFIYNQKMLSRVVTLRYVKIHCLHQNN